jgi:predicted dithiol-disulfide oxidoreductase (DUF899 family)
MARQVALKINNNLKRIIMAQQTSAIPKIVTRREWLTERKALLEKEKAATRTLDSVRAARRRLPMVKVEKDYIFNGPDGELKLADLFDGRRQLLVHHFMYFDKPDRFCPGCSLEADQNYNRYLLEELHRHSVTLAAICRAPVERILEEKENKNWNFPFYSSRNSDFNYDFQATIDPNRNLEYNYRGADESTGFNGYAGDTAGKSVFLRDGDTVYHTYSAYARGTGLLATHYNYLDLTPYGRQEAWEDSPEGWPQNPTYET